MLSTASAPAGAQLSAADLAQGKLYIEQTRDGLLGTIRLLTSAQWEFEPAPGCWSIAHNVNHVVVVQERVMGMLHQGLASAPPPPEGQDREIVDRLVIGHVPNRLAKFPSPVPVERGCDQAEVTRRFRTNCETMTGMLSSIPGLREHALESAPLRAISKGAYTVMDGYQWILAAAAHCERHTKQILEVIAGDGFPVQS